MAKRLPDDWITLLFTKLQARYGDAFLNQYGDADPGLVRADWAEVLRDCTQDSIRYALQHLPHDRPPNCMQFLDLAAAGTIRTVPGLAGPPPARLEVSEANRAKLRKVLHALQEQLRGVRSDYDDSPARTPPEQLYESLLYRAAKIGAMGHAQAHQIACMHRSGLLKRYEDETGALTRFATDKESAP